MSATPTTTSETQDPSQTPSTELAAPAWRRVVAQTAFETRMILRNGEQLLLTVFFPLAALVKGWQEGIPGMKVGGRRQLTCPPELAYGPAGAGHFLSGKTLIFVIDLLGVE